MDRWKITQGGKVVSRALIAQVLGEMKPPSWRTSRAVVIGADAAPAFSFAAVERVVDKLNQRLKAWGFIEHEGQGRWHWRTDVDPSATVALLIEAYDEEVVS